MSVEWTNQESSRTKCAIASLGYITDPFIELLCAHPLKRTPEINRGYYARTKAVDHLVRQFCLREKDSAQIVNIGCGWDSLFFRLKADPAISFGRFVDVDSSQVIARKVQHILKNQQLTDLLQDIQILDSGSHSKEDCLHSKDYHLIACDATKVKKLTDLLAKDCAINRSDPVLFVFECVLLYWSLEQTSTLIQCLSKMFNKCSILVFDLLNTSDTFAKVMQQSLSERDTPLLGISESNTLDDWQQKLRTNGYPNVIAWDMTSVYSQLLPYADRERIEKLEFLDETELLTQLLQHYCLVMASNYSSISWD